MVSSYSGLSSNVTSWERTSFIILSKKPHSSYSLSHSFSFHYSLKWPHLFIYLIIICFSLFECKLYVNRNRKAPCTALWMDSQLSEEDAFCGGVTISVVKKRCGFYNLEENCKDARCNIFWHYSLLSKIFFLLFSPYLDTW